MKIQVHAIQFTADEKLLEFIDRKVGKLAQYFDRITSAEVFMSFDSKSRQIKDKQVTIKLNIPGTQLVAVDTSLKFEEAVNECVNSLRRQLKKYKEKLRPTN